MTDDPLYSPLPTPTQEDIDALASFIKARVKPLHDSTRYDSEERKALQALLDITGSVAGSAGAELKRGDVPRMEYYYLTVAAQEWGGHPDFQAAWDPYG